jgi:hypothetical protein
MDELRQFFESEKSRIFAPDAFFSKRVMARLQAISSKSGIWEILPRSTRPVLMLALMLILCFVAVELFVPQIPQREVEESVLESEQSPAESLIYNELDVPARQVVLQQLITTEDEQ